MRTLTSKSLARRIVISVMLGLSLILTIFGLVSSWTVDQMVQSVYRERLLLAKTIAEHVDDILLYSRGELTRTAQLLALDSTDQISADQKEILLRASHDMGTFATIALVGSNGNVIWIDPPGASMAVGMLDSPALTTALKTGATQIGELPGPTAGTGPLASVNVPVVDGTGRVSAVLSAEINPRDRTLSLIPASKVEEAASMALMNTDGRVVAGTPLDPRDVHAHRLLLSNLMSTIRPGVVIHSAWANTPGHLVAYAPVPSLPTWGVVIEQSRDVAFAASQDFQRYLLLAGVVALVTAISLAWLDARRVTRPLQTLAAVAERFAAGQLDEKVRIERADEVGVLAHAFETMRQQLKRSLDEIESYNRELAARVELRTREVENRNRQLAATNAIAATVSSSLETNAILVHALERVLDVTGLEYGNFLLARSTGNGAMGELDRIGPPLGNRQCENDCLCTKAMREAIPVLARDVRSEARATVCHEAGLKSVVAVPLHAHEHVLGVLFLGSSTERSFEQRDLDALSAIGQQIGMALANARLFEEVQAREQARVRLIEQIIAAQEGERQRIARDLHDSTGQSLSAIIMGLEAMEEIGTSDEARLTQRVERTKELARNALTDLRELVFDLRPIALDDLGLVPALRAHADRHLGERGVLVSFESRGLKERLPSRLETSLFRVLQEAVNNVAKHAYARSVSIRLLRVDKEFTAVVEDDGVGFDPTTVHRPTHPERGLGLLGIRERIEMLGGSVQVESAPGAGTKVSIHLSLSGFERGTL